MFFARPGKTDKRPAGDGSDDDDFGGAPTSVFSALNTMQADHIKSAVAEVRQSGGKSVKNTNSGLSNWDQVSYGLENRIAANGAFPLTLLAFVTSFFLAIFGVLWYRLSSDTAELVFGQDSVADGVFMAVQLITSASFNDIPDENNLRLLYFVQIFFGLVVFAILVGFITDAVSQFMNDGARVAFEEDRAILTEVHRGMRDRETPNIDLRLDAGAKLFRKQLQKKIDAEG